MLLSLAKDTSPEDRGEKNYRSMSWSSPRSIHSPPSPTSHPTVLRQDWHSILSREEVPSLCGVWDGTLYVCCVSGHRSQVNLATTSLHLAGLSFLADKKILPADTPVSLVLDVASPQQGVGRPQMDLGHLKENRVQHPGLGPRWEEPGEV